MLSGTVTQGEISGWYVVGRGAFVVLLYFEATADSFRLVVAIPTAVSSSRSAYSTRTRTYSRTGNAPIWVPEQCGTRPGQPRQPGRLFHRVYDHRDKKRSRFADCPDLCYSDWPRSGRSPPPPPAHALPNSDKARTTSGKGFIYRQVRKPDPYQPSTEASTRHGGNWRRCSRQGEC